MKFPKTMKPIKPVLNWLTVRYAPGNSTVVTEEEAMGS